MQVSAAQRATRGVQKKLDLEMAALEEAREDGETHRGHGGAGGEGD
jgi:hypothetical protein